MTCYLVILGQPSFPVLPGRGKGIDLSQSAYLKWWARALKLQQGLGLQSPPRYRMLRVQDLIYWKAAGRLGQEWFSGWSLGV